MIKNNHHIMKPIMKECFKQTIVKLENYQIITIQQPNNRQIIIKYYSNNQIK